MNADQAAEMYVERRDKITELNRQIDAIKEEQETISTYFSALMDQLGVKNIGTAHGTVFFKEVDFARVADWDVLLPHIKATGNFELLNHAVNKTAVRGYVKQTGIAPPGVDYGRKRSLNVRRSAANGEALINEDEE